MSDLSNLKVGDKVIRYGNYSRNKSVHEVVKITPSGLIDIKINSRVTERYNKDGYIRGSDAWLRAKIESATDETIAIIKSENRKRTLCNELTIFKYNVLPLETLEELWSIIIKNAGGSE